MVISLILLEIRNGAIVGVRERSNLNVSLTAGMIYTSKTVVGRGSSSQFMQARARASRVESICAARDRMLRPTVIRDLLNSGGPCVAS